MAGDVYSPQGLGPTGAQWYPGPGPGHYVPPVTGRPPTAAGRGGLLAARWLRTCCGCWPLGVQQKQPLTFEPHFDYWSKQEHPEHYIYWNERVKSDGENLLRLLRECCGCLPYTPPTYISMQSRDYNESLPGAEVNMSCRSRVVLLCCGSFNPITNMHLRMFELARDALHKTGKYNVIGGIISPVNDRYGKKAPNDLRPSLTQSIGLSLNQKDLKKYDLVPAAHRCAMVKLALKTSDWIRLDTWESEQEEWQRTAMVIRHHKEQLDSMYNANPLPDTPTKKRKLDPDLQHGTDEPDYRLQSISNMNESSSGPIQLKLLCGADLLESFGTPGLWQEQDLEEIVNRHGLVCISRGGSNPEKFIYESDLLTKYKNNILLVQEWITNEISSTRIRRAMRRGESVRYLVQDPIIDYIKQHSFYGCVDNKYISTSYPTPAQSRDELDYTSSTTFDDENNSTHTNRDVSNNFDSLTPEVRFLSPNHYQRLDSEEFSRSDFSSTESLTSRSPRVTRRSVSCIGPDITGLVRRVKNMRVALTPETCV